MKKLLVTAIPIVLIVSFFLSVPNLVDRFVNGTIIKGPYNVSAPAQAFHDELIVIDLHSDVLLSSRNILETSQVGHVDVPRLIQGNVAIQAFTVPTRFNFTTDLHNMPSDSLDLSTLGSVAQRWPVDTWFSLKARALYQASRFDRAVTDSNGKLHSIKSKQDLERYLVRRGQDKNVTAGFLGMEGLHPIEGDLSNIDVFYAAGFRMLAPTHFFDNEIGGSAHGVQKGGLTKLGRQAIERMKALNITLDLSHASQALIDDALEMNPHPVLVSHTGVKGTCDNPRNLSDKHLKGIAATGGVIGIGFFELALCGDTLQDLVNAIRYTTDLVGVDHVGLGSDFDGLIQAPFDSSGFAVLTEALLQDGYSHVDISKIMGGNTLRVLRHNLPDE